MTEIRFDEEHLTEAIPAYLAIIAMPLFYSISEGISLGIISYVLLNLAAGKGRRVAPADVCAGGAVCAEICVPVGSSV